MKQPDGWPTENLVRAYLSLDRAVRDHDKDVMVDSPPGEELWQAVGLLLAFLIRHLNSKPDIGHEVEDLADCALIKITKDCERRPEAHKNPVAYLRTVANDVYLDYLRRITAKKRSLPVRSVPDLVKVERGWPSPFTPGEPDPAEMASAIDDVKRCLDAAVQKGEITDAEREIFVHTLLEDSIDAIAASYHLTVEEVKNIVAKVSLVFRKAWNHGRKEID